MFEKIFLFLGTAYFLACIGYNIYLYPRYHSYNHENLFTIGPFVVFAGWFKWYATIALGSERSWKHVCCISTIEFTIFAGIFIYAINIAL
jgi:hypothetical protein